MHYDSIQPNQSTQREVNIMQDDIDLTQGNAAMDAIDQETVLNALGSLRAYGLETDENNDVADLLEGVPDDTTIILNSPGLWDIYCSRVVDADKKKMLMDQILDEATPVINKRLVEDGHNTCSLMTPNHTCIVLRKPENWNGQIPSLIAEVYSQRVVDYRDPVNKERMRNTTMLLMKLMVLSNAGVGDVRPPMQLTRKLFAEALEFGHRTENPNLAPGQRLH
ncbi:hypothetical protein EniLVp02_0265 [Vibrio phage EniLVp02]